MSLFLRLMLIVMLIPMGVYKQALKHKESSSHKIEMMEADDLFEKMELASIEIEPEQFQLHLFPEYDHLSEGQDLTVLPFNFITFSINQISFFFLDIPPPALC